MEEHNLVINSEPEQSLTVYTAPRSRRGHSIEGIIGAWLDSKKTRSGSAKTQEAYKDTIVKFRAFLAGYNLDLLPEEEGEDFLVEIADAAQAFTKIRSADSRRDGEVSPNSVAQRLAVLSSFYRFCLKRRHLTKGNPIDLVDRPKTEPYSQAQALSGDFVIERLSAIDTTSLAGMRDYALLSVLLYTGRRAGEVQALRRKHVTFLGNKQIKLDFKKAKGGKQFKDVLSPEVSAILAHWLSACYRGRFLRLPDDTPIWVNVHHPSKANEPLQYDGIRGIVKKHLDSTRVHTTRHTFAVLMEKAGAKLTDIQVLLGHENPATTGIYLEKLTDEKENPFGDELTRLLGLKKK